MLSALVAALLAAPDAGPPARAAFQWDVPALVSTAEVGQRLEARGLPLKVHLARSSWRLPDLYRHYARRFEAAGFYVDPHQGPLEGLSLPRLTALDPDSLWSYTIIFYAEVDRTTTLVLGAADLKGRKTRAAAFAPVPPAARGVAVLDVEAGRSLSFQTDVTAPELLEFYRATLPTQGWTERKPGDFVRQGRRIRLLTRAQGAALQVVVLEEPDLAPPTREELEAVAR